MARVTFVSNQSAASLTCEHNFPRHKDEQDNSGFDHPVNQSWKQLGFIAETEKPLVCEHHRCVLSLYITALNVKGGNDLETEPTC